MVPKLFEVRALPLKMLRTYLNVGDLAEFRKMFVEFVDRIYFDGNLSDFQTKIMT